MTSHRTRLPLRLVLLSGFVLLTPRVWSAQEADLHVAVYSSGFLVVTQRAVTHGTGARRVNFKTYTKGTADGDVPESGIEIDRPDLGKQWFLDPRTKTYTEQPYMAALDASPKAPKEIPTLKIGKVEHTVSGPLGSDTINGIPCQAYTIRLNADFVHSVTGKVMARETLLEKLWVADKAPGIQEFRKEEEIFQNSLKAIYGSEKASFRWLVREFNRQVLAQNGTLEDFKLLQAAYRDARASIAGVTVRQLAGWNWQALDPAAPGGSTPADANTFIAAIAAGLGAPPDQTGKTPLTDAERPRWVQDLEKDLGRTGPSAMMLQEVLQARSAKVAPDYFEIPAGYKKP